MVQMQLGKYYQKRLEVGVQLFTQGLEFDKAKVDQRFVEFAELELKWPEITSVTNMNDAKVLFKLSNTQFKKATEFYVLDGFVTENVTIKQSISSLYK